MKNTRTQTPYAEDRRRNNPGRPTDADMGISQRDKEIDPPEGDIPHPRVRIWVEGELVVPEWDQEAHTLKDTLPALLKRIGLHADRTLCPGLVMRDQVLPNDGVHLPPKRFSRRTMRRHNRADILTVVSANQGLTLHELVVQLFPDYPEPAFLYPRVRVALNRLQHAGLVEYRKAGGLDARWYSAQKWEPAWTKRARALAIEIAAQRGGHPYDYHAEAAALENVITYNSKAPDPTAWQHPTDAPF